MRTSLYIKIIAVAAVLSLGTVASIAYATHSWGGYHWARTANQFTLKLGDNVSTAWDSYLATASSDWTASSVLDTTVVTGAARANCKGTKGRVEVCDRTYGNNGWLGIAQIWVSGLHITQGTVKMNDTYFNSGYYNTSAWRNLVMCQEIGHTLGLDHQDTNFYNTNLGTCMDYTNDPSTNQYPNQHDYDELALIYGHTDSTTTVGQTLANSKADVNLDEQAEWGKEVRKSSDGHTSLYERDLGNGHKVFTFVTWAKQSIIK